MPLVLGGAGLMSALRVREPACWSSWMDCLPTIHKRHPVVANQLVDELEGQPTTPFLSAVAEAVRNLTGTLGFSHFGSSHFLLKTSGCFRARGSVVEFLCCCHDFRWDAAGIGRTQISHVHGARF